MGICEIGDYADILKQLCSMKIFSLHNFVTNGHNTLTEQSEILIEQSHTYRVITLN